MVQVENIKKGTDTPCKMGLRANWPMGGGVVLLLHRKAHALLQTMVSLCSNQAVPQEVPGETSQPFKSPLL